MLMLLMAAQARADVCVWRDPERTMQRIFPNARDYKTVNVKVTPDKITQIEKRLGSRLDDSEKGEFSFYEITGIAKGKPEVIGSIVALAVKGEYGVIEAVIGVDGQGKVSGAYIQRSRERTTRFLESTDFLKQFVGKTVNDPIELGKDIRPASPDSAESSRLVAFVIRKMLIFYEVLQRRSV